MEREIEGRSTSDYLWNVKNIVPILKVDKGLADESDGVRLMKPMPGLDELLDRAAKHGVFGTEDALGDPPGRTRPASTPSSTSSSRSARHIVDARVSCPILEPEVDIHCPDKAEAERILEQAILDRLETCSDGRARHAQAHAARGGRPLHASASSTRTCVRVVALSGGYSRDEANERLARQHGMVASFSRALSEGLSAQQSDERVQRACSTASIESIFQASKT